MLLILPKTFYIRFLTDFYLALQEMWHLGCSPLNFWHSTIWIVLQQCTKYFLLYSCIMLFAQHSIWTYLTDIMLVCFLLFIFPYRGDGLTAPIFRLMVNFFSFLLLQSTNQQLACCNCCKYTVTGLQRNNIHLLLT